MKRVLIDDILKDVRVSLDENQTENEYLGTNTDNMELDEIIRDKVIDAVRVVLSTAPVWMTEPSEMVTQASWITKNEDGTGQIKLPEDFLRFVSLKMKGWSGAVTNIADEGSPIAIRQRNKYVRGTPDKPVCVLSKSNDGNACIEFYSVSPNSAAEVERGLYVKLPVIIQNESAQECVEIPDLLYHSVIYYLAGLTCLTRKETEAAKNYFELSKSYYKDNPV